jgi:HAD superfamily hydrolase (TIGR01549 family)
MLTLYQILSEEMKNEEDLKKIEVFPEVSEVLGTLKKNDKKIAVVSGNSVTHIGRVLKIIGLDQYFDFYVGGDSTKNPKPFADPLLKAMELSGNPLKETCLYIGDSLQDPECAKNAGIDGFLLDRKNEYAKEKWPIIHNLKELLNDLYLPDLYSLLSRLPLFRWRPYHFAFSSKRNEAPTAYLFRDWGDQN